MGIEWYHYHINCYNYNKIENKNDTHKLKLNTPYTHIKALLEYIQLWADYYSVHYMIIDHY